MLLLVREGKTPFFISCNISQIVIDILQWLGSSLCSLSIFLVSKTGIRDVPPNFWRTSRSADKKMFTGISSTIFIDCDNLMVSKGLPLVKQQNYIATILKQGSFHFGIRCVRALTACTRWGGLRHSLRLGMGRFPRWFGIDSYVIRWKEQTSS